MKIVKKSEAICHKNEETCIAREYRMDFGEINCAAAEITGRYPGKGFAKNEICKEFAYIISGSGKININGKDTPLEIGDLVCIEPGEKYYFDGCMELFIPCVPAWTPEQYKIIE